MERKIDLILRLATPVLAPAQFPLISDVRRRRKIYVNERARRGPKVIPVPVTGAWDMFVTRRKACAVAWFLSSVIFEWIFENLLLSKMRRSVRDRHIRGTAIYKDMGIQTQLSAIVQCAKTNVEKGGVVVGPPE